MKHIPFIFCTIVFAWPCLALGYILEYCSIGFDAGKSIAYAHNEESSDYLDESIEELYPN